MLELSSTLGVARIFAAGVHSIGVVPISGWLIKRAGTQNVLSVDGGLLIQLEEDGDDSTIQN